MAFIFMLIRGIRKGKKPLRVSNPEIYNVNDGSQWLRLKIQNLNSTIVKGCYGKLLDRKMIGELPKSMLHSQRELAKSGNDDLPNWQLPPEGHRFPWSLTDHSLTSKNISGNGSSEYLYLVNFKWKARATEGGLKQWQRAIWFPREDGYEYVNYCFCDFKLTVEIGSEVESIKPTRVQAIFRTNPNGIELVK